MPDDEKAPQSEGLPQEGNMSQDGSIPQGEETSQAENPPQERVETVNFDDLRAPVIYRATTDFYIALQPPDASPHVVVPEGTKPQQIVDFVSERLALIRELRTDMIKRYEKSPSLRCHYQTGDVAYLFGRPFMLRLHPIPKGKGVKSGTHGRANVSALMHNDVSVIDLFVLQTGNHDQARFAFESFARPVFVSNAKSVIHQCCQRTSLPEELATSVSVRPMRSDLVRIDERHKSTWISEDLLPYPPDCIAYAFLREVCAKLMDADATEEDKMQMMETGLPNWRNIKALLDDPDSPFKRQLKARGD